MPTAEPKMVEDKNAEVVEESSLVCGIVMPISELDGCSETHWSEVQEILSDAIEDAGFEAKVVSNADEVGLIHKRIIQNLYDNPVVVCDVSGKNPNVMFELGLRLAFDKPTIIVKDDRTSYSSDTGGIEHIEYPRDLRFGQIVDFKKNLSHKIKSTHEIAKSDIDYTTFLKHFGEFKVAKLDKKEIPAQEFILDELKQIRESLASIQSERIQPIRIATGAGIEVCMARTSEEIFDATLEKASQHPGVENVSVTPWAGHKHLLIIPKEGGTFSTSEVRELTGRRPKPLGWRDAQQPKAKLIKPQVKPLF
jgi:hypothetical protein